MQPPESGHITPQLGESRSLQSDKRLQRVNIVEALPLLYDIKRIPCLQRLKGPFGKETQHGRNSDGLRKLDQYLCGLLNPVASQ